MENTKITIDAVVSADANKVWDCYTNPKHITQWNFASEDWCCPKAENDLRVGGTYLARMEAKDGSRGFDFSGVYDKVVLPQELAYTLPDGRKVTTIFEAMDGATKVTTIFDAETENSVEMQKFGWQAILNNFKNHAEASA